MSDKISKEYINELEKLHSKKTFGTASNIPVELIKIIEERNINSILDFGSGKENLSNAIKLKYPNITLYSYDPVTSPIEIPTQVDLTFSSDVLEHVEPEHLDSTLNMLFDITSKFMYHLIACHPAKKTLSDGRNAHLIIEDGAWWRPRFIKSNWDIVFEETRTSVANTKKIKNLEQSKYVIILKKDNK